MMACDVLHVAMFYCCASIIIIINFVIAIIIAIFIVFPTICVK